MNEKQIGATDWVIVLIAGLLLMGLMGWLYRQQPQQPVHYSTPTSIKMEQGD